jgi:hypothetical protein
MTDDLRPGPVDALTPDVIRSLFASAPRLSMGVPRGFARFNRPNLLASEGIDEQRALLIDEWVLSVGGRVRSLQPPPYRGLRRGGRVARHQRATLVWEIPKEAL